MRFPLRCGRWPDFQALHGKAAPFVARKQISNSRPAAKRYSARSRMTASAHCWWSRAPTSTSRTASCAAWFPFWLPSKRRTGVPSGRTGRFRSHRAKLPWSAGTRRKPAGVGIVSDKGRKLVWGQEYGFAAGAAASQVKSRQNHTRLLYAIQCFVRVDDGRRRTCSADATRAVAEIPFACPGSSDADSQSPRRARSSSGQPLPATLLRTLSHGRGFAPTTNARPCP